MKITAGEWIRMNAVEKMAALKAAQKGSRK